MKPLFRSLAAGLCLCALCGAKSLNATDRVSENMKIPFVFTVDKVTLPAGEYRVQQEFGKDVVSILNINTGRRVRILRDSSKHVPGRARLMFEHGEQGYRLAKVF